MKSEHGNRSGVTRREFIWSAALTGAGLAMAPRLSGAVEEAKAGASTLRPLGNTGVRVSMIGLGGYHIGTIKEEGECISHVRRAIDQGITFMDNCWDYHDGKSEIWMGKALKDGYRDKVFLMTKIDGQTREAAAKQIDECLSRLGTDRIDLMQFHEVIRPTDADRIFAEGGMESLLSAQKAGKVRFIGFTGHKDPALHLKMLDKCAREGVRINAVQMPLNVMDAHFRSFEQQVLPRLVKEGIGVLGMKSMGSGQLLRSKAATAVECLMYALSLPTSVVITGIENQRDLDQAVKVMREFKPLDSKAREELLARSQPHAGEGQFEPFKTTTGFDGTARNPQWLG